MEMDQMLQLIEAVSESPLTEFQYDAEGVKISLKKEQQIPGEEKHLSKNKEAEETSISDQAKEGEGTLVKSPLVGTFYAAPAEDEEPFVQIGDIVQKGQTVAIVEAMKLMNDIACECSGTIAEIYVKNGETVEYGQPLFRIVG